MSSRDERLVRIPAGDQGLQAGSVVEAIILSLP